MSTKIKQVLDSKGISVYKASKVTKIPQSTLSYWINGRVTPGVKNLSKLATFLDVNIDELI